MLDIDTIYIISSLNHIKKYKNLRNVQPYLYKTRSQTNKTLLARNPTKTTFVRFIDYIGIKLLNMLPGRIKELNSNNAFKKEMCTYVCKIL